MALQIPLKAPTTQAQAKSIGITQTPQPSHTAARKPVKSVPGIRVGLRPAHNVEIFDLTTDKTQFLPYLVHCTTCSFEGRLVTLEEASALALTHAGK